MPQITLNKKVFERLVGKKLELGELKNRISLLGTDLDSIEKDEINLEIFPNRPDFLSEQGFARALSSFIGVKTGLRKYKVMDSKERVIVEKSVSGIRPYTAVGIVKGIRFDNEKIKEIIQIQEKLHITYGRNRRKAAIGIYPYEKITPPIYFRALPPEKIRFMPLESDRELSANQILSQHPAGREYGHLLEGLEKYPVFVDSKSRILSMPPIINSHDTGKITERTREVFIECSGFDFNTLRKCLNMVVTALADMGGQIYSMELVYQDKKYKSPDLSPVKMKIGLDYVNKRLGISLTEKELKGCLEKMGYGYDKGFALIPAYRADVMHQIDITEDVAIAFGYENFKPVKSGAATTGYGSGFGVLKDKIAEILVGLGLLEVSTYNLADVKNQNTKMDCALDLIGLGNALNIDYNVLRGWVIPCLLEVLKNNKHHEYPQNIFEIGTVFRKSQKTETKTEEASRLAVAFCSAEADYTRIKQALDYLFQSLDMKYEIAETEHNSFIPGRAGRVVVGKEEVGYIGEIHPKVLAGWDINMPVAAFELNLSELFRMRDKD